MLSTGLREQREVCALRTSRGRWVTASSLHLALLALLTLKDLRGRETNKLHWSTPFPVRKSFLMPNSPFWPVFL